jgi:prevent-host-death family protein
MEEIAVSKFKATCLSVMERVRKTRKPVLVTRFGVPIAQVAPPSKSKRRSGWRGSMAGTAEIIGDIMGPISSEDDWDAAR